MNFYTDLFAFEVLSNTFFASNSAIIQVKSHPLNSMSFTLIAASLSAALVLAAPVAAVDIVAATIAAVTW